MSYIEREVALQIIDNYAKAVSADAKVVVDAIRDIVGVITPTADVVEVKHGKWLKTKAYPHRVYCSECYKTYVTNELIIDGRGKGAHLVFCTEAEYCPHCGARMNGERREG